MTFFHFKLLRANLWGEKSHIQSRYVTE